jgi:signal transduction histidine kinase
MRQRLDAQMRELRHQDELRRELVANISHDLRTPLTSMQGYLEALLRMEDALDRDERRRYLEVAVRQSVKVSRLAQQLFELAKLECEESLPQPERFSISELVQDIAQKFALAATEKKVRLDTRVENEALFVEGDIGMIERVVTNLIDNAIRHTPEHGEVRLEARSRAGEVEILIADTGAGISEEHMPGLLVRGSPIRRMAARRGGGLGLLIASRILDLHGSAIRAASRVGEGTRVSFALPRVQVAAEAA